MLDIDYTDGENYYWFGIGSVGFFTQGKDTGLIFADSMTEARDRIREQYPIGVLSIRKAMLGEWDCDSFTNGGHVPHE
jgi:hypothetical protein